MYDGPMQPARSYVIDSWSVSEKEIFYGHRIGYSDPILAFPTKENPWRVFHIDLLHFTNDLDLVRAQLEKEAARDNLKDEFDKAQLTPEQPAGLPGQYV